MITVVDYSTFITKPRNCLTLSVWSRGGGGGATKWEGGGGHVKFYPYKKGGGAVNSFSHAEGGAQQVLG